MPAERPSPEQPRDEEHQREADPDGWSEQIYVFTGCLHIELAEQIREVGAGEFFMFPSNQPHAFRNNGQVVVRFVRNIVL